MLYLKYNYLTKERCIITSKSYPWEKYNNPKEYEKIVQDIYNAMKERRLVFFIGSGISKISGYETWNGYIKELFNYWIKKINELRENSGDEKYQVAFRALQNVESSCLGKNEIDNKRKVDLLYEILMNVIGEEKFKSVQLDFEKNYFINQNKKDNPVLSELVRVDATYITTNYDDEIEKYLNKYRNISAVVKDMNDLTDSIDDISVNTVIHLHGIPNGNPKNFISSGESYKEHYYSNFNIIKKIKKWISERKMLIVFLGVSMQEDEVLALLSKSSIKHISFMDTYENKDQVHNYLRDINKSYFLRDNNTRLFWYGDDYDQLQPFIKELVQKVMSRSNYPKAYYDFINNTRQSRIIEILNNHELDGEPIDISDDKITQQRCRDILKSKILDNPSVNVPSWVWDILYDDIDCIELPHLKKIVGYLCKNDQSYLYNITVFF